MIRGMVPSLALSAMVLTLVAATAPSANPRFAAPDLETVPVERLIANLERAIDAKPKEVSHLHFALARTHAAAYASKHLELRVQRSSEAAGPWFGHLPRHVPFDVAPTRSRKQQDAAMAHLRSAIDHYRLGLTTALETSDTLTHRLGLAWCIDRFGDRKEAIERYRRVFAVAWEREQKRLRFELGMRPIAAEAAAYLAGLLDPRADAAEINELRRRARSLERLPRAVTPVLVPLRDGVDLAGLVNAAAGVSFDLDGSGRARAWGWPTPDAGWLVWDPTASGEVRSGLQLFGAVTFHGHWRHGYDALAALDDDGDGRLSGAELDGLAVWRDADSDGVSDAGEVLPVARWGITGLAVRGWNGTANALHLPGGVHLSDGRQRSSWDWWARTPPGMDLGVPLPPQ